MKIIIFCLIIAFTLAQKFPWEGKWEIWDTFPKHPTIEQKNCCHPTHITFTTDLKEPSKLFGKIEFKQRPRRCPAFDKENSFEELIINGQFEDDKAHSKLHGAYGLYRPNNRTIYLNPGVNANCIWILGNKKSIVTNSSKSNEAFNWNGTWNVDGIWPALPKARCPIFREPINVFQDKSTNSTKFIVRVHNSKTKVNQTIIGNMSIFSGAFMYHNARGFFLPNKSVLIEYGNCFSILNKHHKGIMDTIFEILGNFLNNITL